MGKTSYNISVWALALCLVFLTAGNSLAKRVSVSSDKVNIRSGPGTNYEIVATLEGARFFPLDVIKTKGEWYKIKDFQGYDGWIFSSLVTSSRAVITTSENCNIRSGPGTKYDVVMVAEKGVAFKVIKTSGKWLKIRHADGDAGWIHNSLVW